MSTPPLSKHPASSTMDNTPKWVLNPSNRPG
jgi:hypothetical protein